MWTAFAAGFVCGALTVLAWSLLAMAKMADERLAELNGSRLRVHQDDAPSRRSELPPT